MAALTLALSLPGCAAVVAYVRREWTIFQCANGVHMTCQHADAHLTLQG